MEERKRAKRDTKERILRDKSTGQKIETESFRHLKAEREGKKRILGGKSKGKKRKKKRK